MAAVFYIFRQDKGTQMNKHAQPVRTSPERGEGEPLIKFLALLADCPSPEPADRSLNEQAPLRALRHCVPFSEASGFGWWLRCPLDFQILWEGHRMVWRLAPDDEWVELKHGQIPGSAAQFNQFAPPELRDMIPPFLSALPERGVVQIWSGWTAQTRKGWSLIVRGITNKIPHPNYFTMEGIVEFDVWPGPIFTNIQLLHTDQVVSFAKGQPIMQVQPVLTPARLRERMKSSLIMRLEEEVPAAVWTAYRDAVDSRRIAAGAYKSKVTSNRNRK